MNASATTSSGGFLDSETIGSFAYGIGFSLGLLLIVFTITWASKYCTPIHAPSHAPPQINVLPLPDHPAEDYVVDVGIDEATLQSYPMLLYSEVRVKNKDATTTATCCSICLADYKGSDMLRLLPDCGHLFHLECVDPWLRRNPTCPVCRTSPIPTPLSTPLADVVPLASQRVQ
ncbi:unnamed protein product [Ilex paraguariensis]|uniref:RING-type E3 ubiquitin transferase n=1 Tax=Ilex paraguariensis TaxID=185542 RepID=A0ABC8QUB1_9AQUA